MARLCDIGVVYDKNTKTIIAVVNPDYQGQLDDTAFTHNNQYGMFKVPRGTLPDMLTPADVAALIAQVQPLL